MMDSAPSYNVRANNEYVEATFVFPNKKGKDDEHNLGRSLNSSVVKFGSFLPNDALVNDHFQLLEKEEEFKTKQ